MITMLTKSLKKTLKGKKIMENPFKLIHKFNKETGLMDKGYSNLVEPAFIIEEALEGFNNLPILANKLGMNEVYTLDAKEVNNPKEISRWIVSTAITGEGNYKESNWKDMPLKEVDILDKHLDAIVYSVGAVYKLGLSSQQLEQALNIVMQANMKKLKNKKFDEHGKLLKNEDFVGPEEELQKILNKRQH